MSLAKQQQDAANQAALSKALQGYLPPELAGIAAVDGPMAVKLHDAQLMADAQRSKATDTPYTLGPGQRRYVGGNVIAEGAPKTREPRALTSVDKNAILQADDQIQMATNTIDMLNKALSINDKAGSGYFAGTQAFLARNDPTGLMDQQKGQATTEFNNIIMGQALGNMKAIFGGNPTEGERAVLLQMQGMADKSPQERKAIIERGITLAKRRLDFNMQRKAELKSGQYFGEASTVPTDNNQGAVDVPTPDQQGSGGDTYFDSADGIPEGATVVDDNGQPFQKINGQLVPVQ
jgi:hypothetical protein